VSEPSKHRHFNHIQQLIKHDHRRVIRLFIREQLDVFDARDNLDPDDTDLEDTSCIKQMPRISMLMFGVTSIRPFFLIRYSLSSEPTKFCRSSHVYSQTTTAITI
jgi:hypothetical protein